MDGLEKLDQSHAVFSGFNSAWQRGLAFFLVLWLSHFVGLNIYGVPAFIDDLRVNGLGAIGNLHPASIAWLPVSWIGAMFESFNHVVTFLYIGSLPFALLATLRSDDLPMWAFGVIIIGQPIDTFLVSNFDDELSGVDFGISVTLLVIYVAMAVGGLYWWRRLREDHGEPEEMELEDVESEEPEAEA